MHGTVPVVRLCTRYIRARNIQGSTLCLQALSNARAWENLPTGRVTVRTVDRLVQWLSDHWPEGLEWPADIPRPAPTPTAGTAAGAR